MRRSLVFLNGLSKAWKISVKLTRALSSFQKNGDLCTKKKLSSAAKNRTDIKLKARETEVLAATEFDWEAIKPKLRNEREVKVLMDAVAVATDKNEAVGAVLERLESLGGNGIELAKKIRKQLVI